MLTLATIVVMSGITWFVFKSLSNDDLISESDSDGGFESQSYSQKDEPRETRTTEDVAEKALDCSQEAMHLPDERLIQLVENSREYPGRPTVHEYLKRNSTGRSEKELAMNLHVVQFCEETIRSEDYVPSPEYVRILFSAARQNRTVELYSRLESLFLKEISEDCKVPGFYRQTIGFFLEELSVDEVSPVNSYLYSSLHSKLDAFLVTPTMREEIVARLNLALAHHPKTYWKLTHPRNISDSSYQRIINHADSEEDFLRSLVSGLPQRVFEEHGKTIVSKVLQSAAK